MRQLIYSSRWTDLVRQDMVLAVQRIVSTSIQNNRMIDVTGFLLSQDGLFIQLLEGPARAVGETFGRISADVRHDAITVLSDIKPDRRLFQEWNMAGLQLDQATPRVLTAETALALLQAAAEQQLAQERRQLLG
jgi:hypothetical protein